MRSSVAILFVAILFVDCLDNPEFPSPVRAEASESRSFHGFVLPVVSAIAHSANVWDCLIWSAIALIVQIVVYYIVKIPVPNLSARIAAGELAAAIWLGLASLAAGALNAACIFFRRRATGAANARPSLRPQLRRGR